MHPSGCFCQCSTERKCLLSCDPEVTLSHTNDFVVVFLYRMNPGSRQQCWTWRLSTIRTTARGWSWTLENWPPSRKTWSTPSLLVLFSFSMLPRFCNVQPTKALNELQIVQICSVLSLINLHVNYPFKELMAYWWSQCSPFLSGINIFFWPDATSFVSGEHNKHGKCGEANQSGSVSHKMNHHCLSLSQPVVPACAMWEGQQISADHQHSS